jgi:chitin disaccharide deacetylase
MARSKHRNPASAPAADGPAAIVPDRRLLVVNADAFGLSPGVSRGVARAFDDGIVTSASLLANMPGFEAAVAVARARPGLGVGLHLNLTDGSPVLPLDRVPSLVGDDGRLVGYRAFTLRLLSGRIRREEIVAEITAQLERLASAGITPTHLDGHRHIHLLPVLFDLVADAAVRAGIPHVRCPAAVGDRTRPTGIKSARALGLAGFGRLQYGRLTERGLTTADCFLGAVGGGIEEMKEAASRLGELPAGLVEWMVHPGQVDAELIFVDDALWAREEELRWLTSDEARQAVVGADARLVDFCRRPKIVSVEGAARSVA